MGLVGSARRMGCGLHVLGLGLAVFDLGHGHPFGGIACWSELALSASGFRDSAVLGDSFLTSRLEFGSF